MVSADAVFASEAEGWSLQGVRPANHPRTRLRQYAGWACERPDWPARVLALAGTLPQFAATVAIPTRDTRRIHRLSSLRTALAAGICADVVGGTRLNNLICDGLFPLLAAESGRDLEPLWHHWYCGDLPPWLTSGRRQLGFFDRHSQPATHGSAQGLLGWFLARETSR